MKTLKIEILGFSFNISYEDGEKDKLLNLVESFKNRLIESPENIRISSMSKILLAALKTEDLLEDSNQKLNKKKRETNIISEQKKIIDKLNKDIFSMEEKLNKLNLSNLSEKNSTSIASEEISRLQNLIELIKKKIKKSLK